MNIVYSEYGLANRYDNEIELNVNLKNYPELHNKILRHELDHEAGNFTVKDFKHDLTDKSISIFSLIKFFWRTPKALTQFIPIYKHYKHGWVYDSSLLIIYFVIILIVSLSVYFGIII